VSEPEITETRAGSLHGNGPARTPSRAGRYSERTIMSVTIDLPPEIKESLAAQAAARGVSLADHLHRLLADQAGASKGEAQNGRGTGQDLARRVGASRYETGLRRGDQPREHLHRARVGILLDTNVPPRRVQLPAMRAIGCSHNRIEAGCAITSVSPKSPPLNNSGARMTAETA
jgi:hypothetical protein